MATFVGGRERSESGFDVSKELHKRGSSKKCVSFREFTSSEKKQLEEIDFSNGFNSLQEEAVREMKKELQADLLSVPDFDELVSDVRFLRFLRGHLFNIGTACEMYRKMLAWRVAKNVNAIREDIVSRNLQPQDFPHYGRVARYCPSDMTYGVDIEGRPLQIELVGRANPKKMQSSFSEEEWIRYTIYCTEYNSIMLNKLSKEQNTLVKITIIYDLNGAGKGHMSKQALDILRSGIKITGENYPESMQACFIVNAPTIFSLAWKLIKPMLAERTVKKIKILGASFQKTLHQFISDDNLPVEYGGNRTEKFPLVFDTSSTKVIDDDYTILQVSKIETVSLHVSSAHYVLWGFFTDSGSIKVEHDFTGDIETEEESKAGEESTFTDAFCGSFKTQSAGKFSIAFDNSSAWRGKKSVSYYMFAVPLDDHKRFESPRNGKLKSFFE